MLATFARERHLCPELTPHFAVCFDGPLSKELTALNAPVHMLGNARMSRPWTIRAARRNLARLLQKDRFDVVACHSTWPYAIFAKVVRELKIPLAIWLHSSIKGPGWLERWAGRIKPDLAICVSRAIAADYCASAYPGARAETLYNPISIDKTELPDRSQTRAELETPANAVVIIQVSRMEAWKGQMPHIAALGNLKDMPNWICWQVGGAQRPEESAYLSDLKNAAIKSGIAERVRFLGQRDDVPRLLAAADIFCQPNLKPEGFGLVFIEAFQAQLPIVTSAMGSAKEIINEDCGILLPPDDIAALTAALRRLILDEGLRARMGAAGQRRARELSDPAIQLQKLCAMLADILPKLN